MKTLPLVVTLLFLSLSTLAQEELLPISPTTGKVSYEGIVTVQGQSQEELYTKAKQWVAVKKHE